MRKLSISVALALPVLAACAAKNPARSYVAPVSSTTNPLACVMWAASADLGYSASQRGVDEASMKFERGYGSGLRPKRIPSCHPSEREGPAISSLPLAAHTRCT
jgi:hypothetical protein